MSISRRAKRMERHHKRAQKGSLNLVSLMDIFTILVFFLLVNTSEVEVLPSTKAVKLPQSASEVRASETHIILVTRDAILLNGNSLITVDQALAESNGTITSLVDALKAAPVPIITNSDEEQPLEVTIMGDQGTPYKLLKRVMRSASAAGYTRISLAVELRPEDKKPVELDSGTSPE